MTCNLVLSKGEDEGNPTVGRVHALQRPALAHAMSAATKTIDLLSRSADIFLRTVHGANETEINKNIRATEGLYGCCERYEQNRKLNIVDALRQNRTLTRREEYI